MIDGGSPSRPAGRQREPGADAPGRNHAAAARRRVLLLSVAANVALATALGAIAVRRLSAHQPAGREAYGRARLGHFGDLAAHSAEGGGPDVVIIGASSVDWAEWHELLGRPIANRGVSGDRVADVMARLDSALAGGPRLVVLSIGLNDLLQGRSPAEVASDQARLVTAVRGRRPAARVVVVSVQPVNEALLAANGERLSQATIDETNRLLAGGVAAAGAEWLDVGPHLARADGQLDERFTVDGVHLTGSGYRAWAEALGPHLPRR